MSDDRKEPNAGLPGLLEKLSGTVLGDITWGVIGAVAGACLFGLFGTLALGWSVWGSVRIGALAGAVIGVMARGLFRGPLG